MIDEHNKLLAKILGNNYLNRHTIDDSTICFLLEKILIELWLSRNNAPNEDDVADLIGQVDLDCDWK